MRERYESIRILGRGAAGEVHLVRDQALGGRLVALKRIRTAVDSDLREAMEREFATLASLSLHSVAPVYDFGFMAEDGGQPAPFFTRAYIEGLPLNAAAEPLDLEARIRMVAEAGHVVARLHRAGVVHGDLKPGNIIIDVDGRPHLIDFGLAQVVGVRHRQLRGAGTPPFMAPEVVQGAGASVASDVYALGATLWVALTGALPYAELGERALSAKLRGERPRIPIDAAGSAERALQAAQRALALEPLDRFPTMHEFVLALDVIVPPLHRFQTPGFVVPRPRGRQSELLDLENQLQARLLKDSADAPASFVLAAPSGGGKTTLMRELKWRLQLRGAYVLETTVQRHDDAATLEGLREQIAAAQHHLDADRALRPSSVRQTEMGTHAWAEDLGESLRSMARERPVAIFVDGIDVGGHMLGEMLRSALHAADVGRLVLLVSSCHSQAPAVVALHAEHHVALAPLTEDTVNELATEALEALDVTAKRAIYERSQGVPGVLVELLAALATLDAVPSADDVRRVGVGTSGEASARLRLVDLDSVTCQLLQVIAACGGTVPLQDARHLFEALSDDRDRKETWIEAMEPLGLVARSAEMLSLADAALSHVLLSDLAGNTALPRRILDADVGTHLSPLTRTRLALAAGMTDLALAWVPTTAEALQQRGAHAIAAELYEAVIPYSQGLETLHLQEGLWDARLAQGDYAAAAALSAGAIDDPAIDAAQRGRAALAAARALTALSRFDEAIAALQTLDPLADAGDRARAHRELAKIHLRKGDYDAVAEAARNGLACAPGTDLVRVELLTSAGMAKSYRGDREAARQDYEGALSLARAHGSASDEAVVLTYMAIDHQRAGELEQARRLYTQSLEVARTQGDLGNMSSFALNLGAVLSELGEPVQAEEHYDLACRLAQRAGRLATEVTARNNLAQIHSHMGLYQQARMEAERSLHDAEKAGLRLQSAQARGYLADIAARTGDVDSALRSYDDAIFTYEALGQRREMAEAHLDAAAALLDRDGLSDTSAAVARLASGRTLIDAEGIEAFRPRLRLLTARARLASGDVDGAAVELEAVVTKAQEGRDNELEWQALAALAVAYTAQGVEFSARRAEGAALECLEKMARRIPRERRDAFWQDPRRRLLRIRVGGQPASQDSTHHGQVGFDQRMLRLLELIKRLAMERDVDRLLERITESAVDLSGAEWGLVLLTNEQGTLEPHVLRGRSGTTFDDHTAFSRSIAEAVLIDGEPIVAADARSDRRVNDYMSVHKLMLCSVACLPVRGPNGVLGVLYLEHRRRAGRFHDTDVDLLFAFADQAAIVLENARLSAAERQRSHELELANIALEAAKAETEALLMARTEALDEARQEVHRALSDTRASASFHGMIGSSPKMRSVYGAITRVRDASVPVVIQGESGSGKELVARAIHYSGQRAKGLFVVLNCAAVPETLLESELFGHVRGAFTGATHDREGVIARASGGTLFLDEVGDMPMRMQVDLLRVLQERRLTPVGGNVEQTIDTRFVAASNRSLKDMVRRGSFREDLYYRLNVVEIHLPPLRERLEDVPLLSEHFLHSFAKRDERPVKKLTMDAVRQLQNQSWPGNVRQLEHVLLNAWVLVQGEWIRSEDLALDTFTSTRRVEGSIE